MRDSVVGVLTLSTKVRCVQTLGMDRERYFMPTSGNDS